MARNLGYLPETDGINHLNIYSKGKTALGQMLSNFYNALQIKTEDGLFWSVETYWAWLSIPETCPRRDELRRKITGYQAKMLGNELVKEYGKRFEPDFERKILLAIRYKILFHQELVKPSLCQLPFVHYYCWIGKNGEANKMDVTYKYRWMVDGIKEICTEISQSNKEEIKC